MMDLRAWSWQKLVRAKRAVWATPKKIRVFFRRPDRGPKVFCIGYGKTGTTSLGRALEMLGYFHASFNQRILTAYEKGRLDKVIAYAEKFEAFDDLPWLREAMIPILDKTFAGSKYIYLERDEASWRRSLARWSKKAFGKSHDVDREWNMYVRHQEFVRNYFKDRPNDLLVLDIRDPLGFRKLADFLGKKAPQDAFPHLLKSDD